MSSSLRGLKRQLKYRFQRDANGVEVLLKPLTKEGMTYMCRTCGKSWRMWLQTGLEEHGENHKPVPFAISCKHCAGTAYHVDWHKDMHLEEPIEITEDMDYFANYPNSDCGVPVFRKRGATQAGGVE